MLTVTPSIMSQIIGSLGLMVTTILGMQQGSFMLLPGI